MMLHLGHRAFSRSGAGYRGERAAFFQWLDSSLRGFFVRWPGDSSFSRSPELRPAPAFIGVVHCTLGYPGP
jgi:hypothetical protein